MVFKCIENLDTEIDEINKSQPLKRAKDLLDGKKD